MPRSTNPPTPPAMTDDDPLFMRRAIALSRQARADGNAPYGALLVKDGVLLAEAGNRQFSDDDCTAHAETVLVRAAQRELGLAALRGSTVYASGEPCAMCSGALFWAGVRRVVYGASQAEMARVMGGQLLPIESRAVLSGASETVEVDGPCLGDEAIAVLEAAARGAQRRG